MSALVKDPISGLFLPGPSVPNRSGPSAAAKTVAAGRPKNSIKIDNMLFYSEDGQICWEDSLTGKSGSKFPDEALALVKDMAKNLLGQTLESCICDNRHDRNRLLEALRALETLAKEALAKMPSRDELNGLLKSPRRKLRRR